MADLAASIIGAAVYGFFSAVTSITSLVAFGQSMAWTSNNCRFNATETYKKKYPGEDYWETTPCDFNRWLIYLWAFFTAALGAYVGFLIVFRTNKGNTSNWRPVTKGITFSLILWLIVFWAGWAPSWPGSPTGYFSRDLQADGTNWIPIMISGKNAIQPVLDGLPSAKATIWLAHITA